MNKKLDNLSWYKKDIIIAILIVMIPLLYYVHLLIPEEVKVFDFFLFKIEANCYADVATFIWMLSVKVIFLLAFSIWFVTCKHWWRYSILVPLVFGVFQFIIVLSDEISSIDEQEFFISTIISIPIIGLLLLISRKLNYYKFSKNLARDINDEIQDLWKELSEFNSEGYKQVVSELKDLRAQKAQYDKKTYLKKLLVLRDALVKK